MVVVLDSEAQPVKRPCVRTNLTARPRRKAVRLERSEGGRVEAGAGGKDWTRSSVGQSKDFGFYSKSLGSPLEGFPQGSEI